MRGARLFLGSAATFLLGAVAASAQPGSRGSSRSNIETYARLLAMTDSRTFDRALVDSALASGWAPLRAAAALGVGQVGEDHGMPGAPLLRELLSDRDPAVASNAAYALGLLGDSASVKALSAALGGAPRVGREAAWALGEIGAPAREAIVAGLSATGTDQARTIQLLLAAAKLRPIPIAQIRRYLSAANQPSVLWAATYAISRPRSASGVRDLISLANKLVIVQSEPAATSYRANVAPPLTPPTADAYVVPGITGYQRVRAEIARAMAKSVAGDSLGEEAFTVLSRLALDPDPHVRINAVRSLGSYGPHARTLVIGATRDADANARIAAAQSLATILDSTVAGWSPLWAADTSLMYRGSLLSSAAHADAMLPQFVTWQGHPDWRYRASAVSAVNGSPNTRLAAQLGNEMISDKDARVRVAAYSTLAAADTAISPPTHAALMRGLTDPDYIVRSTVLDALTRKPNAADAPSVVDVYERSAGDSSNDARIAAIHYLAVAWHRDSAAFSRELRDRIERLRPSGDPLVRAEAAHTAIFRGWESTSGTSKPLDWYQSIVRTYVLPSLAGNRPRATIRTARGDIVLDLFGADAPITVDNFMRLARSGYYRGTRFHRVVPNFVVQDGDPRGDGNGGPGYAIRDELNPRRYERGVLGMALSGPDTGGSQYFITHSPQPHLDGHYTVFGRVLRGFAALDALVQGDAITAVFPR